jgi:hypothetical protein
VPSGGLRRKQRDRRPANGASAGRQVGDSGPRYSAVAPRLARANADDHRQDGLRTDATVDRVEGTRGSRRVWSTPGDTTTTGSGARRANDEAIEPTSAERNRPSPRLPTTTISARSSAAMEANARARRSCPDRTGVRRAL